MNKRYYENILQDFRVCAASVEYMVDSCEELAKREFVKMCVEVALNYGHVIDKGVMLK